MNIFNFLAPIYNKFNLSAKKTFRKINKFGQFQKSDTVLDLGGGSGRIAKFFVGEVKQITVLDVSLEMIKECQKQNAITCILGTADKLSFQNNSFDKIIIIDAFHHFTEQPRTAQKINQILKPGGKIIIEEFNPQKFLGWLAAKIEKTITPKSNFLSPQILAGIFRNLGLKTELVNKNSTVYYLIVEKPL